MQNHASTQLLIQHLSRVWENQDSHPERVQDSIDGLLNSPAALQAAKELHAFLGPLIGATPVVPPQDDFSLTDSPDLTDNTDQVDDKTLMFFISTFNVIKSKLDEIISLLKAQAKSQVRVSGGEVTSPELAALSARVLANPKSTKLNKRLAGALLTQAPDKE